MEGYIFDRRVGATLTDSFSPAFSRKAIRQDYHSFFRYRQTELSPDAIPPPAKAGKHWLKKYWEKKAAGEKNIELTPEKLD